MIREAIAAAIEGRDLTEEEMAAAVEEMMTDQATPSQAAALLVALRMKGEAESEIFGMAKVMREKSVHVDVAGPLLDTCSTGGGAFDPFNVSTAAALVCAGAGVRVAKHGNRGVTSQSGSADVLEALGARLDLTPGQVKECIEDCGFAFMLAPSFHPAMRFVGPTRREIGVRTLFNVVAPITNPAGAQHQLVGVGDVKAAPKIAAVLARLGAKHAMVVHGEDGLDELSIAGPSVVYEVREGKVFVRRVAPEDAGLSTSPLTSVATGTASENASRMRALLGGEKGPVRDFVLLNSAAALMAADRASDLRQGVAIASEAIDKGAALAVLDRYVGLSQSFANAT